MSRCLINGVPGDMLSVQDRGLAYGDGVFETIAIRDGVCRFQEQHFARLKDGCERLQIPVPEAEIMFAESRELTAAIRCGVLKWTVTRGIGPRGYSPPKTAQPTRIIQVTKSDPPDSSHYRQGVGVRLCATRIGRSAALAGCKSLNRLEQVLARAEWSDPNIHEGLMLDEDDHVVCGTMTNVFVVKNGEIITPSLNFSGVSGIMRQQIFAAAETAGIGIDEQTLTIDDVVNCDEIFLSNAIVGIWPVTTIDSHQFDIGPITRQLMLELAARGVSECA
jgi:4-amino-4-deoxychorismate lyase